MEGHGAFLVIDREKLSQVKYLNVVLDSLACNYNVMSVGADFSPPVDISTFSLWKTTKVSQFAARNNLHNVSMALRMFGVV